MTRVSAAVALVMSAPAHAEYSADDGSDYQADAVTRWQPYIDEASLRFGIPTSWIARVMRAESAGKTMRGGRSIRSRAGAMGLMQLMPATWAEMRARLGLGADPDEPRANILAGTLYLRIMYDRFGYPGLFGAYNAGPARYAAYLDGAQRLPGETTAYLAQVAGRVADGFAGSASGVSATPAAAPPPTLFAVRREGLAEAAVAAGKAPETTLFAIRKTAP